MYGSYSIIVPVTSLRFLSQTLLSIDALENIERSRLQVVLLNNGTTEDVAAVARACLKQTKFDYIEVSKEKSGYPTDGWNRALEACDKDWVCLLGDDDCYAPDFIAEIDALLGREPGANYLRGKLVLVDSEDKIIHYGWNLPHHETGAENIYYRLFRGRTGAVIEHVFRRETLKKIGGYQRLPQAWGSDDLTCFKMAGFGGIYSTNRALAKWRRHEGQISSGANSASNSRLTREEYLPHLRGLLDASSFPEALDRAHFEAEWAALLSRISSESEPQLPQPRPHFLSRVKSFLRGVR